MTGLSANRCPVLPEDISIPIGDDGDPIFAEPWEARTFAVVINAFEQGRFEWKDFQSLLVNEIRLGEQQGNPKPYYLNWAIAAEKLFDALGTVERNSIDQRVAQLRPDDKTVRLLSGQ